MVPVRNLVDAALLGLMALTLGCQAPLLRTGTATQGLQLTFLISGPGTSASTTSSVGLPGARLLVPNARTLTVTLTAKGQSSATATQTVSIAPGASQATLSFADTPVGHYTVAAQAFDSTGALIFGQTSGLELLSTQDTKVVLNLVPASSAGLDNLASGVTVTGTLASASSRSWFVPGSELEGSISVLLADTPSSVLCYVQSANGAVLNASATSRTILETLAAGGAYVTLYNGSSADQAFSVVLNAPGTYGVTVTLADTAYQNLVFSPAHLRVVTGHSVTLGPGFTGGTGWRWTVTPAVTGTTDGDGFAFTPTQAGDYTVSATVTGGGLVYSGSMVVNVVDLPRSRLVLELLTANTGTTTISDTSVYQTNGTISGDVTPATAPDGSAAYQFSNGGSVTAVAPQVQFGHDQAFSVSGWLRADPSSFGVSYPAIWGQTGSSGQFGYLLCMNNGVLSAEVAQNNVGSDPVDVAISPSTWYHAVMVYDGSSLLFYLNGVYQGSVVYDMSPSAAAPTGSNFKVGGGGGGAPFSGLVGRCRVYNRVLTADEVSDLYHE